MVGRPNWRRFGGFWRPLVPNLSAVRSGAAPSSRWRSHSSQQRLDSCYTLKPSRSTLCDLTPTLPTGRTRPNATDWTPSVYVCYSALCGAPH